VKTIQSIPSLRAWIGKMRKIDRKIAFVPTMGALHEGHLALVRHARRLVGKKGVVVVSIYVNPSQFNRKSDLQKYPRVEKQDLSLCRREGVDMTFLPATADIYPSNFSTWVEENQLSLPLCGATRPGHFKGVCTIVCKLFNLVQPDLAVFGQKDAQQLAVIKRMVRDLDFPIKIVESPTIRESDGLAMSSRNLRLTVNQRIEAPKIHQALLNLRSAFRAGKRSTKSLIATTRRELENIPGLKIDYLELVDSDSLSPRTRASRGDLVAVAAFMGDVRLIDNIRL
jgi:pantoate--beta-alanine ligase